MVDSMQTGDVFTPTSQATINFVDRPPSVNDPLVDALSTRGKQVIVFGESGSGKSTLLQRKLEQLYPDHITTRCTKETTYDALLLDAFDQLGRFYVDSTTNELSRNLKGSLGVDFLRIKTSVESSLGEKSGSSLKRVVPPQLTAQRLGEFMGAEGLCWVLEDFHKVPEGYKASLSQALKVFSDLSRDYSDVRVVAIGATDTARQVVQYDSEMRLRVAEIKVPLMSSGELEAILINGGRFLGVDFSAISGDIVSFSSGLAGVCHHLALNACLIAGIYETCNPARPLTNKDLSASVERYVNESSDTLKALFDSALMRRRIRKYDNTRLILHALAKAKIAGLLHAEILSDIRKQHSDYPASNLTNYLRELTCDDRGQVLRQTADGRYRFSEPMFHSYAQLLLGVQPSGGFSGQFRDVLMRAMQEIITTFPDGAKLQFEIRGAPRGQRNDPALSTPRISG